MKTKINSQNNENIEQVKTVWSDEEANELFKKGWELLHGGLAHRDNMGYNAKPCYVMVKKLNEEEKL